MRPQPRLLLLIACVASLLVSGCGGDSGPPLYEAGGVVTYNGNPVKNATVTLTPNFDDTKTAPIATAITNEKGEFKLRSRGEDGAAPGNYIVTIEKTEGADEAAAKTSAAANAKPNTPEEAMQQMAENMKKMQPDANKAKADPSGRSVGSEKTKHLLPEKYSTAKFSGLTAKIAKGSPDNTKLNFPLVD